MINFTHNLGTKVIVPLDRHELTTTGMIVGRRIIEETTGVTEDYKVYSGGMEVAVWFGISDIQVVNTIEE